MAKTKSLVKNHVLIPEHIKLNSKEKEEVFAKYGIAIKDLPKIDKDDPALASLNAKEGDVIKIIRKSVTAGETVFYRGILSE